MCWKWERQQSDKYGALSRTDTTIYSNLEKTMKTYIDLFIVYFTHYVEIMDETYDR